MKNTARVYVLLFSLLTSAATNCSLAQLCNKLEQQRNLAREESNLCKADRKAMQDEINANKHRTDSATNHFNRKKFNAASIDAKRANSISGNRNSTNQSHLTNSNKVVVGSTAWAASKNK